MKKFLHKILNKINNNKIKEKIRNSSPIHLIRNGALCFFDTFDYKLTEKYVLENLKTHDIIMFLEKDRVFNYKCRMCDTKLFLIDRIETNKIMYITLCYYYNKDLSYSAAYGEDLTCDLLTVKNLL